MRDFRLAALFVLFALSAVAQPVDLSLSVNNGPGGPNYSGWPVLLTGTIALTDDSSFVVRPSQISISVFDSSDRRVDIAAAGIANPTDDITLENDNDVATFRYALSPEQTASLSGAYTFEFSAGEFKTRSTINLAATPDPLPSDLATTRRLAFADYHLATGNPQAALDLLNEELGVAPKFVPAMSRAAMALEQLDRRDEALRLLSDTIDAVQQQNPDLTHPPRELIRRYSYLLLSTSGVKAQ